MPKEQTQRLDHFAAASELFQPMLEQEKLLKQSGLEHRLVGFVKLRASQINVCAFCINMHWQEARALGDSEERLYLLDAWRKSSVYTAKDTA